MVRIRPLDRPGRESGRKPGTAEAGSRRDPVPPMKPRGELAIVLHTHMPYVEGFGIWPFGEEWLWEEVAPPSSSPRAPPPRPRPDHAVADAGAVRPARGAGCDRAVPAISQ